MLLGQHPLAGLERALEERLGLAIAALGLVENARLFTLESVSGCSGRARAHGPQRALKERLGLAIAALGLIE